MSGAAKIQADYEQLGQIASQFAQQGDRTLALGQKVYNCVSELQNGGWIGVGAQSFYKEMESLVLPGLERLMNALNISAAQTERIAQILRSAEEEAGQLFHGSDETYSVGPATGGAAIGDVTGSAGAAASGGMNLGGMIGMAVGGMLGGPLGAVIGGRIGNAIGSGPFALNGTLSVAEIGKSKPFSPLKMFEDYIGADPARYRSDFGHEFSEKHLFEQSNPILDRTQVKLAGDDLWNQRAAALRGDLDFQAGALRGNLYGELASYDTSGKWEATIGRDGVAIGASGQMGAYLARVGVSAEVGGLEAAAQAYVGAHVQGEIGAVLLPGQAYVNAGGEIFLGGKAEGSLSYTQQIVEGLSVESTVSGYVSYGIGAQADVKFGYDEGKIHIGGTLGATLGVGVGGKFDFTIDAAGIVDRGVQTVQSAAGNVVEFSRGVVDIGRFLFSR